MKETEKTAESLTFKLSELFSQLGSGEIKYEPQKPNDEGLQVLGVVNNPATRKVFSISEEIRLSIEAVIGGPVERVDELLDNMTGPAKRQALDKLRKTAEQAGPVKDLFWAMVKEEIPRPDGCSCIAIHKGWEIVAVPPKDDPAICEELESAIALPLSLGLLEVLERRARAGRLG